MMRRCLLGCLLVLGAAALGRAAELCLAPSNPGGLNGTVSCATGEFVENDWTGFRSDAEPCVFGAGGFDCVYGDPPSMNAYCWTLSSSITNPNVNTGPFTTGWLYLWLRVANLEGMASLECSLQGDFHVAAVEGMNGFVSTGGPDPREIRLAVAGCPPGPIIAARILIDGTVGVDDTAWGSVKAWYR